ncbi:RagB/SusD family nutrient uptake outer membrane protein, partial [Chryseobacterium sp. CCH4-E10]
ALAGLYAGLWTNSLISGGIDGMGALMGTYTDDLTCVYTSGSNGILDIANNQQVVTNTVVTTAWTNAYGQIYAANSIIEGVTNSKSLSQASKDRIKGEALLVRSIIYFNLYQIFGEIAYTETTN